MKFKIKRQKYPECDAGWIPELLSEPGDKVIVIAWLSWILKIKKASGDASGEMNKDGK